jgi:MFS family permease
MNQIRAAFAGMRSFATLWSGQVVSQFGSGLTSFGLGVWIYEQTKSVSLFGLIIVAASLPGLLLMPVSGVLVDRHDRRSVIIAADVGAAVVTAALGVMAFSGRLAVWNICVSVALVMVCAELRMLAMGASVALLVPRENLGRAAGLLQTGMSATQVLSPVLAGVLLPVIGLQGLLLIDLGTYLAAVGATLLVRIPHPAGPDPRRAGSQGFMRDLGFGWRWIAARPALLGLLAFFTLFFFAHSMTAVLFTPLVLAFTTPAGLGAVVSIGSVGGVLGGLVMSAYGGPRRRVAGSVAAAAGIGLSMMLAGLRPSVATAAAGFFGMFFLAPFLLGSLQVVWQMKTPPEMQGRVFAVRRMIPNLAAVPAFALAGVLADRVFEPLLMPGGALASTVGQVTGVGDGRGTGLLFMLAGLVPIAAAAAAWASPRVRRVEEELPDALPAAPGRAAAPAEPPPPEPAAGAEPAFA